MQVRVQNAAASLRREGGARVTFHASPPKSGATALLVPKAAIQKQDGTPELFVVRDGRAQRRAVAAEERAYVEVTSSVNRGEHVVVQGADGLTDGDRIRVTGLGGRPGRRARSRCDHRAEATAISASACHPGLQRW